MLRFAPVQSSLRPTIKPKPKLQKGRGYCDVGTSVISEFYTPLVPKGHDFLQTIGRLAQERQAMPEQQGKEDVIE